MRTVLQLLFCAILSLACAKVSAQARYNVSGVVTNEIGEPLKSATVFIGGSERVMSTDENGQFNFSNVPSGTFQLSVQMLGYNPLTRNIIVQNIPLNIEIKLAVRSIRLDEVKIGGSSAWDKNFKLFKETFLGRSENAKQCVILNPKVISFSTKKGLLMADADDFLIIENKRLGYRIHYQLKTFGYNYVDDIALYNGECSFEQLAGTDDEKKEWAKNRLATYKGSFMHFLRSVYARKTVENGFITKPTYGYTTLKRDTITGNLGRIIIDDSPVKFDSLIKVVDTNFISLKFKQLYVIYDPKKAANFHATKTGLKSIDIDKKASVLKLTLKEAIVDKKGSYTDYRDFYIHGNWARARVGDQLPVEYQPPVSFTPVEDNIVDKLTAPLQRWTDSIPQEKVYLQTDKPYYVLGDTIWFKGYVTVGSRHQLSALSGALYVDLINEKDSVLRTLKLPITAGMAIGNFILGDDYKQGSYRIRSYTQWMRNVGDDYFFDRTFTVGDLVSNNIIVKADYGYKQVDGKPVLSALLNYANDEGKPIAGKDVHYQVIIDKKVVWGRSATTDASGNIPVNIVNDKQANLAGAYIHTTLDGNDKHTIVRDFPIKANLAQSDVQFFPEGGELVNGISSHVAFKVVGIDGLGIAIKGKIVDETGAEIAELNTLHAGMGSFLIRPQAGKNYTANIIFPDGTSKAIPLPKAKDEGLGLSVYQPNKDSVLVRINASKSSLQSSVGFIAHTGGESIFASTIKLISPVTSIWLDKKTFPTGIAQFTIFNSNGEPVNERIAFIRSDDLLDLNLQTAKTTFSSKEQIKIDLNAKDGKGKPTAGNFSVAVIDESKVPVDENSESTIFSNLLLTSDLKGYIEKPNYYFVNPIDETDKALDNLMLTQGYRRFTWKELSTFANSKPVFPAEGLGVAISGIVTTLSDKPLPGATVNLVSVKAKIAKSATTNAEGKFSFDGIFLTDSIKFTVQARNTKGSDNVKLILDSIPPLKISGNRNMADISTNITGTLKAYLDNGKKQDDVYEKLGQLDKVNRLREVRIRGKKVQLPEYKPGGLLRVPEGSADQTYVIKDPEHCATLGICLQGMLPGVVFKDYVFSLDKDSTMVLHYNNYPFCRQINDFQPMHLIIDGVLVNSREEVGDFFDNNTVQAEDIIKIEVVKDNLALLSSLGVPYRGAVIMVYTNRGMLKKPGYNPSVVNISPKGFNKVREFYSPHYDKPGNANNQPDLRTTVYWNPRLKTDDTGKTSFNFFNADGPGTYRMVVEGVDANGELGRQVFKYTVDGDKMAERR
ncbi:MAG: carboxypeptidase regulatory-like domain-containing protein [Bacteroidota bacterium]